MAQHVASSQKDMTWVKSRELKYMSFTGIGYGSYSVKWLTLATSIFKSSAQDEAVYSKQVITCIITYSFCCNLIEIHYLGGGLLKHTLCQLHTRQDCQPRKAGPVMLQLASLKYKTQV